MPTGEWPYFLPVFSIPQNADPEGSQLHARIYVRAGEVNDMDNLDAALMKLAHAPVPASLDVIEAKVFARIAARPTARVGTGIGAMTVAAALVIGIFGAGIPTSEAGAVSPLSPLGPVSPLAPSTLLVGEP